ARINDAAARREAATSLDHGILGYVTGVELDARFGALFVGLGLDLRQHFGLSTVADRHFLPSAMLRLGAVTELDGGGS
ncbi:MAG: hypothetical protein OEY14_05815, partial [Myxococcales bacterium]|nr:hypothetical protein [Myxococcales bacterium]